MNGSAFRARESKLLVVLTAIIITSAVVAEIVAVKLFQVRFYGFVGIDKMFTLTCGSLVWPLVFLTTDTINEFYGRKTVRFISWLTVVMIAWMWIISQWSIRIEAASFSPAGDGPFAVIMGQGGWIMIGSIAAFLISQLVDVTVFHWIRRALKGRHIWARATGSTIVSQLIDSFVVIYIAFGLPKKMSAEQCFDTSVSSFIYKVGLAVALTPLIYLAHFLVESWLGRDRAHEMARAAAAAE